MDKPNLRAYVLGKKHRRMGLKISENPFLDLECSESIQLWTLGWRDQDEGRKRNPLSEPNDSEAVTLILLGYIFLIGCSGIIVGFCHWLRGSPLASSYVVYFLFMVPFGLACLRYHLKHKAPKEDRNYVLEMNENGQDKH